MNNDAFKHTATDSRNETWMELLVDFKIFEGMDDHIMYLRRRFVLGAAEWMAGKNGSMQNDKLLFDYTDREWEFIWTTMLEDGAWAVPSITDENGNFVKENNAPEILIKFIAHDLKSNIIVFDLQLNIIQFVSGNLLKSDNVVFDSPLLMYATGSHFQSVLQIDHEFFINYAKELEAKNNLVIPQMENIDHRNEPINHLTDAKEQDKTNYAKELNTGTNPVIHQMEMSDYSSHQINPCTDTTKPDQILLNSTERVTRSNRKERITENKESSQIRNKFSDCPILESQCQYFQSFELIKGIKPRNRTQEQKRLFERIRKQKLRDNESKSIRKKRMENDRESQKMKRLTETYEENKQRNTNRKEDYLQKRTNETSEETEHRNKTNRENVKQRRSKETAEETEQRITKIGESEKQKRSNETNEETIDRNTKKRKNQKQKRSNETAEETENRNTQKSENQKLKRSSETAIFLFCIG